MLLTCPKCATRYEVDGSSIPQEGTYAHCATCENIFFVKKKLKAASKDVAKTTISAAQEKPSPQVVEATPIVSPEKTIPPAARTPVKEKEKKALTPEQVAAIMSGIDYEGKPKDEKNDSTNLTAQSQIDSILGNIHNDIHEKVITAPLPSPAAESPKVSHTDIESLLASVQAQRPETQEPAPKPAAKEEVGADDIAAILASVQAQQPAAKKEEPKMATASDIDDIFASVQAQQPAPKKEEPKMATASDIDDIFASVQAQQPAPAAKEKVGADDIAAILASVQAQQPAPKKEEPKMATASDIDDIFASVQAQQPAPAAKEEVGADDIAAILASVQAQQPAAKKEEPKMATASDIDDIFASVQAQQPAAKKEEPKMATASDIDDIFASVQAQQPAPAAKEEVGADDIAAILASVQAQQPAAKKEEPKMATASDIDDIFASVQAQQSPPTKEVPKTATVDDIDAIFAGSNAASPAGTMDSQDDIDAILMTASAPAPQESILEKETASTTQALSNNDIDSILASVKTEKEPPAPAPATSGDVDIISQSDLDSLFAAAAAPSAPTAAASPKETEGDMISQSDLDALLGETKPQPIAAVETPASGDIISQSDLDALMSGSEPPKTSSTTSTTSANQLLESGDDELESLFAQEAVSSPKAPAPKKAAAAPVAPVAEYEGVDTSMFEGLDKVAAETPAAVEEPHVEAESKPGKLSGIIAYLKDKLPKRKEKEKRFTVVEEQAGEAEFGEEPKKKKTGMLVKIALPMAAGVALMLGVSWYYFVRPKSHPVVMAQKTAAPEKTTPAPAQPASEEKKETPPAAPPAHEEAKAEAPKAPEPPPVHEEKPPEPLPTAAQAPKPKDAKEIAAVAHEDARRAALEAEKLIPPALVETSIMKVGVMLPVDFNSSQVKMMTAEVELQFATSSEFKTAETKKFIYELTLENEIEVFFKDKFYEETRYAKDKLMAYLFERIKKRGDLEKIVGVNIAELKLK